MSYKARRLSEVPVEPFVWVQAGTRPVQSVESGQGVPAQPFAAARVPRESGDPQTRLASIERDAFAKGYAQGERSGAEAAGTRVDGMLRRLNDTIDELAALRGEMIRRTERQTVQLVLAIAERVVQREVTIDRGLLLGMARAALDRLGEYGSATIRLHPDDYNALSLKPSPENSPLRVVADPVVTRGGCLVQSDFGFMDVSPESQFRELASALLSESYVPPADVPPGHGIVLT